MIQQLTNFLRLIRWKNILIFLLFQTIVFFRFKTNSGFSDYFWFNLILVFFAAAGNLQNDLYDTQVDKYNHKIKKLDYLIKYNKQLHIIVLLLYLLGSAVSYIFFYKTNLKLFSLLISIPVLLVSYNIQLKRVALLGNVVVSIAIAFVLFLTLYYFFDWKPIFEFYVLMAFLLHMIREIVKDIEDKEGDKQAKYYTLPILSMFLTHLVIKILVVSFWIAMVYYHEYFESVQNIIMIIISLSMTYVIKLINAEKIRSASLLLKVLMLTGTLTILL